MGAKRKTKGSKRQEVRFYGRVQFKTIRHVCDFSDQEVRDGWYNKSDFARMGREVSRITKLVARGQQYDGMEEICTRGLEHWVDEAQSDYRSEKMVESLDAVLDEQDAQRHDGIIDLDVIARIYAEITAPLQQEAYVVALRDAAEARHALQEDYDEDDDDNDPLLLSPQQPLERPSPRLLKTTIQANVSSDFSRTSEGVESDSTSASYETCEEASAPEDDNEVSPVTPVSEIVVEDVKEKSRKSSPPKTPTSPAKKSPKSKALSKAAFAKKLGERGSICLPPLPPAPSPQSPQTVQGDFPRRKKSKIDRRQGTELSPLVRRRDGTFTFRSKEYATRAEMSRQRKELVRDSLSKLIDSPEVIQSLQIA